MAGQSHYGPWPRIYGCEVIDLLKESGIICKVITTRNPQANAMVEHAHQTIHNMICMQNLCSKEEDLMSILKQIGNTPNTASNA
jgi:hypothetical protein